MEVSNLQDIEVKTMVIRMLKVLRGTMYEISENLKK